MVLRTNGLTREFGGVSAVEDVDFELDEERLTSLIGPNGAGKTTFFNLITGTIEPTEGSIELEKDGRWIDITGASPSKTASLGIHRAYQITNLFPETSVLENVRIAAQQHSGDSVKFWRNVTSFGKNYEEAYEILEKIGLADLAERPAKNLSHAQKRRLEVGIALAGDPEVLLLDEPSAGVSSESVDDIMELIETVAGDYAVFFIEHNMDIVMSVSDRIVALNRGRIIADGTPEDIRGNPDVQEAYLGSYGGEA
ncbi:MAG: ABC transporter ATP-binding protein [Halobacteria archaeon]|nr:ABC transporter ATP-binding protein [Halobacteria archaeon]